MLSDIEWRHFLLFDWADDTEDIREQFPLDRALTQQIAEDLGIGHPLDLTTKVPLVMTTDLVVNVIVGSRLVTLARAIKPAAELSKLRILEMLNRTEFPGAH